MPQISIEYSDNLGAAFDARKFALVVHDHVVELIDTERASCKTRLVEIDTVIGNGSRDNAMIHVDLRILSGRSEEQKKRLGEAVLAALRDAVAKPNGDLQLTVEVRELDRAHYHKLRLSA